MSHFTKNAPSAGGTVQAAHITNLEDTVEGIHLGTTPIHGIGEGAKVSRTTGLVVADNSLTYIEFGSEDWDDNSDHHDNVNQSRLKVPAGLVGTKRYRLAAQVNFPTGNGSGQVIAVIRKNGTDVIARVDKNASPDDDGLNLYAVDEAVAGDYYELGVYQSSGVSRTLDIRPGLWFAIERIT